MSTTAMTWGDLTDELAGRSVSFRFPWEDQPTTAVFVSRGYLSGWDRDNVEKWVCTIDYGADVGVQETSMRADAPVEVADLESPPDPEPATPTTDQPVPMEERP